MNAVGIDVSKGKSMVAIVQHFGVVVAEPFEVSHDGQALNELVERVKRLPGETKVVMEYTGIYYEPISQRAPQRGYICFRSKSAAYQRLRHKPCTKGQDR